MFMLADNIITEQLTNIDNKFGPMDIFGSWMELGMAIAAFIVGVAFVWLTVRKHFIKWCIG